MFFPMEPESKVAIVTGGGIYGKSITDPYLGWENTQNLIYEIADKV